MAKSSAAYAELVEALRSPSAGGWKSALKKYIATGEDLAGDRNWPLLHRVFHSPPLVELLIAAGADMDVTDSSGDAVLHYVVGRNPDGYSKKFVVSAALWLAEKPKIDHKNKRGLTALYMACRLYGPKRRPYPQLIEMLVAAGASCDVAPPGEPHLLELAVAGTDEKDAAKLVALLMQAKPNKKAVAVAAKAAEAKGWERVAKLLTA